MELQDQCVKWFKIKTICVVFGIVDSYGFSCFLKQILVAFDEENNVETLGLTK